MTPLLGKVEAHFWLTRSVARAIGLNLTEAMAEGHLSAGDYAALVTSCRAAPCAGRCADWLAAQGAVADAPPPFCANAAALTALKSACAPAGRGASGR